MLHICQSCPGKASVETYLSDLFCCQDFDFDDTSIYKQWVHTGRTACVTLSLSVQEFIDVTTNAFDNLQ